MDTEIKIASAEERAQKYPHTFKIPPRHLRETARVGDYVKIIIEKNGESERLWAEIIQVDKDGRLHGELRNKPLMNGVEYGSPVEFGPEHILDIQMAGQDDGFIPKS